MLLFTYLSKMLVLHFHAYTSISNQFDGSIEPVELPMKESNVLNGELNIFDQYHEQCFCKVQAR